LFLAFKSTNKAIKQYFGGFSSLPPFFQMTWHRKSIEIQSTGSRMRLGLQDDQNSQRRWCYYQLTWLDWPFLSYKKYFLAVNNLHRLSADGNNNMSLPCFTREIVYFWRDILILWEKGLDVYDYVEMYEQEGECIYSCWKTKVAQNSWG
jgi:hypothetical protein